MQLAYVFVQCFKAEYSAVSQTDFSLSATSGDKLYYHSHFIEVRLSTIHSEGMRETCGLQSHLSSLSIDFWSRSLFPGGCLMNVTLIAAHFTFNIKNCTKYASQHSSLFFHSAYIRHIYFSTSLKSLNSNTFILNYDRPVGYIFRKQNIDDSFHVLL